MTRMQRPSLSKSADKSQLLHRRMSQLRVDLSQLHESEVDGLLDLGLVPVRAAKESNQAKIVTETATTSRSLQSCPHEQGTLILRRGLRGF
jgi:hypothetical protein